MIQRIQSLWLFLAASCIALMLVLPIASFRGESTQEFLVTSELKVFPESNPEMMAQIEGGLDVQMDQSGYIKTWPLAVILIVMCIMCVTSIFMFQNRMRQIKVVAFTFLLNVVYVFLLFFWVVDSFEASFTQFATTMNCEGITTKFMLGTWLSFASIVFLFLAQNSIRRDEAKVRAADRLR